MSELDAKLTVMVHLLIRLLLSALVILFITVLVAVRQVGLL